MSKGNSSIVLNTDGFAIQSSGWRRVWRFTSHGTATQSVQFGDWKPPVSGQPEPSECYYQGLLCQDLHRAETFYPELLMCGKPARRRQPAPCGEGACDVLTVNWTEPRQGIRLQRVWRVYPGVGAVATTAAIRADNAPMVEFGRADYINVIDTLPLDLSGWEVCAVSFFGRTDYTNDFVKRRRYRIKRGDKPLVLRANLLFVEPQGGGRGIFVLHEAPPEDEVRPECEGTFRVGPSGIQALGWGIAPHEILPNRYRKSYTVITGGYTGDETARLRAIWDLLKARYPPLIRHPRVIANPWGDGQCYNNLSEKFILRELEACAAMGVEGYQIDDGWQAGGILADLSINNYAITNEFWRIHPEKFPRGFHALAARARELGVKLSLWFAPDVNRHYQTWREQRDLLLQFHHEYGIELFKIDAVKLRTKAAEENLTALLTGVMAGSNNKIRFNMDVTNGRRMGYFASLRFGDIFVENRYVRAGIPQNVKTYVPWRVLRNLWHLAHYLPATRLQFEFPNRYKSFFKTEKDVLTAFEMRECRDDYLAAIPMMAAPLCWAEPSNLPARARKVIERTLALHRRLFKELPDADILPIGAEPNGKSWTGFQAISSAEPQTSFLLIFREDTPESTGELHLPYLHGCKLDCVSHKTPAPEISSDGHMRISIPSPNDFRLYRCKR